MSKYNAKKAVHNGVMFDSKIECDYYKYLLKLAEGKAILDIVCHPKYELQPKFTDYNGKNHRSIQYEADFEITWANGDKTVVDIKGMATPEAKLKRKMFMYVYRNVQLDWIAYSKKYAGARGGWIDYFELNKLRRKDKKAKD